MLSGKLGLHQLIKNAGSLGEFDIDTDNSVRFYVKDAGAGNTITVSGRLAESSDFSIIDTVVGNGYKDIDVSNWDFLKIDITVYQTNEDFIEVTASGFVTRPLNSSAIQQVEVTNSIDIASLPIINKFAPPKDADYIATSYTLTSDVYFYKQGGSGGTLLKTITIIYTDSSKEKIQSVEVV
jgi:hypothetical protein